MPYYNNVLLLAYRRDLLVERASDVWFPSGRPADDRGIQEWVLHSMRDKRSEDAGVVVPTGSWHHVVTLADSLMHATREGRFRKGPEWGGAVDGCPIRRAFCYDQSARETLACALIDALVVGRRGSDPALSINDAFFKGLPDPLPETVIGEVVALSDLFSMTNQVTSRYPLFEVADVLDAEGLLGELSRSKEGAFLSHLSGRMTRLAAMKRGSDTIAKREALVSDLNELLLGESLWSSKLLANVPLSEEILTLLGRAPQGVELIRLNRLILEAVCSGRISKGGKPAIGAAPRSVLELPSDSGVYLCWYSELRDLIDREPALATRLEVIPLPAGGFTGDWFLGIAQGSVSVSLGQKVLSLLSTRQHQYRRFREGVGLPVLDEFYDGRGDFYAWPRGLHVPLSRIGIIHKKALRRSRIESYYLFHAALTTIAERLTPLPSTSGGAAYSRWGDGLPDAEAQRERRVRILENIRRLKGQIAVLKGDPLP
jgi:hypothetical protein